MTDLNLVLNINSLCDHRQDLDEQKKNRAELSSKLDDITLKVNEQRRESLDLSQTLKELNQRFNSLYENPQINSLKNDKSTEKTKIDDEARLFLHIPSLDLRQEECIGQGGFADIYCGTWISHDHCIAIKVIRIQNLTDDIRKEFLNEIAIMRSIRYDHILTVFGVCIEPGYNALVVEYMKLGSLFEVLQKKNPLLSWNNRWSIVLQITKVKVSDFGLAKIRQKTNRQMIKLSEQQSIVGTLQWTAPKLLKLERSSNASDIYSLAIILWELATRSVPYDQLDEQTIGWSICAGNRLKIPNYVPSDVASIISNAWNQDPTKRSTCLQIIADIKKAMAFNTNNIKTE
ncbi:unnamed protein product [Rotaria sordida]|uniref:Protein kinase domain-containing protein n=1 Tax=Rotaria sordida TaxID=392033 RepID=A0A819WNZ5_9BILA|nr:unnamed protein product [Rotaria sordida]